MSGFDGDPSIADHRIKMAVADAVSERVRRDTAAPDETIRGAFDQVTMRHYQGRSERDSDIAVVAIGTAGVRIYYRYLGMTLNSRAEVLRVLRSADVRDAAEACTMKEALYRALHGGSK